MEQTPPTVLIVEDEPIVRMFEIEVAEEAGFLCLQAADADEALEELEGPLEIQILLTDVNMPGSMDGLQLAETVRRKWPDIKVVIVSGKGDRRDTDLQHQTAFLRKPFTPYQLVSLLKSCT